MSSTSSQEYLRCPYCDFGTYHFSGLETHCRDAHTSQQEREQVSPRPSKDVHFRSRQGLSDAELAQLLAFEEAGLPSELALDESPHDTSLNGRRKKEGTNSISSPFTQPRPRDEDYDEHSWIDCVCGERVHVLELDAHADMHAQESLSGVDIDLTSEVHTPRPLTPEPSTPNTPNSFTTNISNSIRNVDKAKGTPNTGRKRMPSLKEIFLGTPASPKGKSSYKAVSSIQGKSRRLGRAELGPFAHERQMPAWLLRMLQDGAKSTITNRIGHDGTLQRVETIANETPGLVPILARLSQLDKTVERAFYCSPDVCHVAKMAREGGFCGYRNIQMLISYIQEAQVTGYAHFPGGIPKILKLQDFIEHAWDMGFNSVGRIETGGIKFTRKYIGTPEAQALFMSLDIPCEASAYTTTNSVAALETMLCAVCEYFDDETTKDLIDKVVITEKPPIYFQHQGHSMTIVGVESRSDGSVNLVVFDPMFNPSLDLKNLALNKTRGFRCNAPERLLRAHRRGEKYLSKYRDFELLRLASSTPSPEE